MSLINGDLNGWRINRINIGPPYHVELVGPYQLPQVEDERGVVALSGPDGAVFCDSVEQAEELCRRANAGELEVVR